MPAQAKAITMYGLPTDLEAMEWERVVARLTSAPLYWVVAATAEWPHPRPVWGVWHRDLLCVSLGSPVLRRSLDADGRVTVHLESATDVVIVEGSAVLTGDVDSAVADYNAKYDYSYDVSQYGKLMGVAPRKVLAWTAAGAAGRNGFRAGGTWTFPS
jgi:hypothetical protein